MIVTVESKARPCPGVERAVTLAEDVLGRVTILYSAGQLIHNRREVERLQSMGLRLVTLETLTDLPRKQELDDAHFLIRAHGESEEVLQKIRECGLRTVDATCPIVRHSQDLVDQHVREGWRIIIAGNKDHPEVTGLLARSKGCGVIIANREEATNLDFEDRSLLLAQTTIDPDFFSEVRRILSGKLSGLKIADTTCRFLCNRQVDMKAFGQQQDVIILVGGNNSANCRLLLNTALEVNKRSFKVEEPGEVNKQWFKATDRVGISGGASTPHWQLEEMRSYLNNHQMEENPKGLKNRKGGKFLWWMRKN